MSPSVLPEPRFTSADLRVIDDLRARIRLAYLDGNLEHVAQLTTELERRLAGDLP